MPVNEIVEVAKVAYDAYCDATGWKSVRGEPLPKWEDQSERLKRAWRASVSAVMEATNV